MNYKVCILAAGGGTRMSPLTEKINKALLPVGSKAVLSHIIEKFDRDIEIVIALGYLKETVIEYLECAHGERRFTFVDVGKYSGEGSGPGFSLMQCRRELDSPFIFFASDTLVLEEIPPPVENWMGVSEVRETEHYCTVEVSKNVIVGLEDKTVNDNDLAFIGVAGVLDYDAFFDALQENSEVKAGELQVSNGFSSLVSYRLMPKHFTWFDTGNLEGYTTANQQLVSPAAHFDFSKKDEFIYFVGDNVIKFFADGKIVQNRYDRAIALEGLCPKIEGCGKNFYYYKKKKGRVLYDVVTEESFERLLSWLDSYLWIDQKLNESHLNKFKVKCREFYYQKTLNRLSQYYSRRNLLDGPSNINGIDTPSVENMLADLDWEYLTEGIPSGFHGDLQPDNILVGGKNEFVLLDWRQDFSGLVGYGDRYYDFAKLFGGLLVSYKGVKQGRFSYSRDPEDKIEIVHNVADELSVCQTKFLEYLEVKKIDVHKVKTLTSLIFLNMAPMHHEPFDHFIYNLGKSSLFDVLKASALR